MFAVTKATLFWLAFVVLYALTWTPTVEAGSGNMSITQVCLYHIGVVQTDAPTFEDRGGRAAFLAHFDAWYEEITKQIAEAEKQGGSVNTNAKHPWYAPMVRGMITDAYSTDGNATLLSLDGAWEAEALRKCTARILGRSVVLGEFAGPIRERVCEAAVIVQYLPTLTVDQWLEVVQAAKDSGNITEAHAAALDALVREAYAAAEPYKWARAKCAEVRT